MSIKRHRSLTTALLMGAAVTLSAPALAQSPDLPDDEERREETVTVYGTSNPIPVFDYPGQVSVITRDDLDTLAPSAVSDALRDVPGLDFAGGPRRTGELPSIRGLSGQNVLILIDGARQSFTSAHDGRFFLDPELIGTAEVVKGPASALYGSGAVGGVLAFESVDAADFLEEGQTIGARVRLGYQSVNEETLATLSGFTRQGRFDGVASIGLRQSGDIELGSGASLPSDDDIQSALLKGSYALTDAITLEAAWQRFDNTAIEPNNGQGLAGIGSTALDRDVEKDIVSDTYRAAITFNPGSNDWIDTTLTAYQTDSKVDEFDQTVPRTISRDIATTGFSVRNASRFTLGQSDNTVTIGADWYEDEQVGTDDQTVTGTRNGVPDGNSEFTGIFVQLESVIVTSFGELLLVPGVRFDEFESSSSVSLGQKNSDDAISPRFAASFEPAGATWFRAFGSYSEGFRAPSINELYLDGVHFSVPHPILFNPARGSFVFVNNNFIPNPVLVPEKTETVEFGAGIDFRDVWSNRDRLQGKLSYFETDATDLINLSVDFTYDPTCFAPPAFQPCTAGTTNSANVESAQLEGWEGEIRYDSERFFSQATLSIIDGTDNSDGSDLGSLTADRLALNFGVKLPEWNSRIGSRIQIADDFERREADGAGGFTIAEQRDGYVVVDLYASWSPSFADNVRLDVGVDNIFEHDYDRVFEGVSEPGRNFKAALSWQFGS